MDVHTALNWRKSSYSGTGPQTCVEVASLTEYVAVRDTKDHGRGTHVVHARAWQAFVQAVKTDRL